MHRLLPCSPSNDEGWLSPAEQREMHEPRIRVPFNEADPAAEQVANKIIIINDSLLEE